MVRNGKLRERNVVNRYGGITTYPNHRGVGDAAAWQLARAKAGEALWLACGCLLVHYTCTCPIDRAVWTIRYITRVKIKGVELWAAWAKQSCRDLETLTVHIKMNRKIQTKALDKHRTGRDCSTLPDARVPCLDRGISISLSHPTTVLKKTNICLVFGKCRYLSTVRRLGIEPEGGKHK
ncbi:hypothetical protein K435DRAFT_805719 [Dendrothele bispora CBS 962.96]|uniref:Uncharacterized protein n=1 Tax=Dendrothele bispora (strain CBS 962.96) TaxID=1314807 RepID=A0A4S8LAR6_DENBC|nr:hypothetical protein K435DRAFT_805719 [Dendrothele bispora CBS 962.96]